METNSFSTFVNSALQNMKTALSFFKNMFPVIFACHMTQYTHHTHFIIKREGLFVFLDDIYHSGYYGDFTVS